MIIALSMMITAWIAPLQAGQMTDGTFFIFSDVLTGGATTVSVNDPYTVNGSLGQALINIETAEDPGNYSTNAGFWFANQYGETIVNFKSFDESVEESCQVTATLVLNSTDHERVTVTISLPDNSQYNVIYDGGTYDQEDGSFDVVFETDEDEATFIFQAIDDDEGEEDEDHHLIIQEVENATAGFINNQTITILKNDFYQLTGTVKYVGTQTGEFYVCAYKQGEETPYCFDDEWHSFTSEKPFEIEVEPGSYSLVARINTIGSNIEIDTWEPYGAYTSTIIEINNDDYDNDPIIVVSMIDPKELYEEDNQFIGPELTYEEWIDRLYPALSDGDLYTINGNPDEDYDRDGYTNFQEFLNGTNPFIADPKYVYDGYDPGFDEDDTDNDIMTNYQMVFTNPVKPSVLPSENDSFLIDVFYTNSNNNLTTTGLGLAIHFDSDLFDCTAIDNVFAQGAGNLQDITTTALDEDISWHRDDYDDTNAMITLGWVGEGGSPSWPGPEYELPLKLCTLKFTTKSVANALTYGDTSVIRFTATSYDVRYSFYASPTIVDFDKFSFDIDGNGKMDPFTDGILIIRYLYEMLFTSSQDDVIGTGAVRTSSEQIWTYLNDNREELDIDGNNDPDTLTDGIMILRYMNELSIFGGEDPPPTGDNAQRVTEAQIEPFIKQHIPKTLSIQPKE